MNFYVGTTDRWVRIVLGVVIVAAGLYFKSWFGVIGLIFLGTALGGWYPLYIPFGISTYKVRSEGSST